MGQWYETRHGADARALVLKALVADLIPENRRDELWELLAEAIVAGRRQEAMTVHSGNESEPPRRAGLEILAWGRWRADAIGNEDEPDMNNRFAILQWVADEIEPQGGRWSDGCCEAWRIEAWWPLPTPHRWQKWNGENWEPVR